MNAKEKAAYVKGLVSGMKLDENRDETKIFNAIVDWMETISKSVSEIEEDIEDICDDLEDMNEDLANLESKCGDSCDCGCSCEDDCDCGCHGECDEDDKFYQISCPNCKEHVCLSEDVICNKDVKCPSCSASLEMNCKCCCGNECEEEYSSSSSSTSSYSEED